MTTRRYIAKDIEPDPCGDFVHQEDHAVVEAERDALAVQVEQLQSELRSVATYATTMGSLSASLTHGEVCAPGGSASTAALEALIHAHRTGQCPPHAGDPC